MKLPAVSGDELIKALKKIGFKVLRIRGSHAILKDHGSSRLVVVPLHDEVAKGTLKAILRQVGITVEQLIELLRDP